VAGYNFIRPDRDQLFLMPSALQDWLPPDDLAYFILDAVDQFDLTPFHAAYLLFVQSGTTMSVNSYSDGSPGVPFWVSTRSSTLVAWW
jgi:hypothetical protein